VRARSIAVLYSSSNIILQAYTCEGGGTLPVRSTRPAPASPYVIYDFFVVPPPPQPSFQLVPPLSSARVRYIR
jgi:hypothetical protein